jgi:SagB-type dehydrogenase family enzyme
MRNSFLCTLLVLLSVPLVSAQPAAAPASTRIALPAPAVTGGMTLNDTLAHRRSVRAFQATKLTMAELSQLLWAAQGITDNQGHRTAPSAHGGYFLHLYVAQPDGFFEYIPAGHALQKLSDKDIRATLSPQPSVKSAPIVFVVAGEYGRAASLGGVETGQRLVNLEAGHAAENLVLEATALKLACVTVGGIDPKQAAQAASLPADISPIYLIPTGHAK